MKFASTRKKGGGGDRRYTGERMPFTMVNIGEKKGRGLCMRVARRREGKNKGFSWEKNGPD